VPHHPEKSVGARWPGKVLTEERGYFTGLTAGPELPAGMYLMILKTDRKPVDAVRIVIPRN